ncbi:MAG TPA: methylated-DNA--[protein]-cysteine S-methyltransferase [Flavisolibacter sp.]|jgi:AraC family transcriptional regulator of adaptative response/methylated-DNA-[protein]-cysteine methyltransferase|nr:methylated-DNA--[protein]-cysteine S-methyltransferase [Flavisolibacter sp.]
MTQQFLNFQRIEKAIAYLQDNFREQPSLDDLAAKVHVSPFHFQKLFLDWVGLSPKKFLQYLTIDFLRSKIQETQNMMDAAELVGLSGQSRVHDLFVTIDGVTPQQFKSAGEGMVIRYGYHPTPYGMCFIAVAERGICRLHFIDEQAKRDEFELFSVQWHSAKLIHDPEYTKEFIQRLFDTNQYSDEPIKLLLKGTNFQLKVWEGLLQIPYGSVASFGQFAKIIGESDNIRSVASAVGKNPIPFLIPCHRIITQCGCMGNYQFGRVRKRLMLGGEMANVEQ